MGTSKIEWCDSVWNPVTGCGDEIISPGCLHCYARRMAHRLAGRYGYPKDRPFQVTLHPERLEEPLQWKKPKRIFVCSMGDLFHPDVPTRFIDQALEVMAATPQHVYLLLTKRANLIEEKLYGTKVLGHTIRELGGGDFLPNLWLGVTVCNQEELWKVDELRKIPAAVHWVSFEPLLSDLGQINFDHIEWCVTGGESGPGARPMHPDWVRLVRDQCQTAGVPFYFKQWGEWCSADQAKTFDHARFGGQGIQPFGYYDYQEVYRVGKKAAGRLLDQKEWNELPKCK